ncbi:hypothetical protein J6590_015681 [Homalodisca vitripennis]|nr:hypothetical protein J6590_015681 [Homalodisca vitripennis]
MVTPRCSMPSEVHPVLGIGGSDGLASSARPHLANRFVSLLDFLYLMVSDSIIPPFKSTNLQEQH